MHRAQIRLHALDTWQTLRQALWDRLDGPCPQDISPAQHLWEGEGHTAELKVSWGCWWPGQPKERPPRGQRSRLLHWPLPTLLHSITTELIEHQPMAKPDLRLQPLAAVWTTSESLGTEPNWRTAGPDVERSPVQGTQACGSSRV